MTGSNLLYHEALWATAKRSSGLVGFRKYFFWGKGDNTKAHSLAKGPRTSKSNSSKETDAALVDIVAEEGTQWIRVSAKSSKRLLFDLAKLGWQNDSDSDEDMIDAPNHNPPNPTAANGDDDEDEVGLVKCARNLARAAAANPIRGHPPRVLFVLTRIQSNSLKEIDAVLDKMRATGLTLQTADDIPPSAPPLSAVLPRLLVNQSRSLSTTLNLDCTILLALISDISHTDCPVLDWYPSEVRAQIRDEEKEKLLPTHLYPALSGHPLVCTDEAAAQMNLIVDTLATDAEKARANILLAQRTHSGRSSVALFEEWASLSSHPLPQDFHLPVRTHPANLRSIVSKLPAVAAKIEKDLTPLNAAIFFHGWAEGITTVSANRTIARQINQAINMHGLEDGEQAPHIWLCGQSRSLIAKHGRRK